jgi:hypothetical protein
VSELVSPSPLVLAAGSDSAGSTAGVAVGTGPASLAPEPHPARSAEIMRRRGSALVMGGFSTGGVTALPRLRNRAATIADDLGAHS